MYNVLQLLPKQTLSTKNPSAAAQAQQMTYDRGSSHIPKDRQIISRSTSTSFNTFGVHNIRSQRILHGQLPSDGRGGSGADCTLIEEHEYFVALPFVRYGIHMSQQSQFGPIFPALRVYHIVDDIDKLFYSLPIRTDIQTAIESGILHPFTRDRRHRSLLHVSTWYEYHGRYYLTSTFSLQLSTVCLINIACSLDMV
jgi:hypothetical protein